MAPTLDADVSGDPESEPCKRRENRRTHRKSKNGCLVCKARRVKCDERRPRCARCVLGNRPCSYNRGNPARSSGISATSSTAESVDGNAAVLAANTVAYAVSVGGSFAGIHMVLLHHAFTDLSNFMSLPSNTLPIINTVIDSTFEAPYLLDQLLALSALHRSVTDSDSAMAPIYRHQATELQTRALEQFNDVQPNKAERKPIPSFLFATLLGFHVLHDTLSTQDQMLAEFVSSFVSYVQLQKGVRAAIGDCWSQILESDLKPLLYVEWMERKEALGRGTETAELLRQLEASAYSSPSLVEACISAARWIQWVLGVAAMEPASSDAAVQAVMAWPLVIGDGFTMALYQHRPEALVVLAYFGAVLHRHRKFWVFGNSGTAVVRSVANHVGSFWAEALAWPQHVLLER